MSAMGKQLLAEAPALMTAAVNRGWAKFPGQDENRVGGRLTKYPRLWRQFLGELAGREFTSRTWLDYVAQASPGSPERAVRMYFSKAPKQFVRFQSTGKSRPMMVCRQLAGVKP